MRRFILITISILLLTIVCASGSTHQGISAPGHIHARYNPLEEVTHWLYLIDVALDSHTIDQIVGSAYEMVVLDFIPSEENNTDFPMAAVIERLHTASHPKLVIAYIDVGQAEDFRQYWELGWEIGNPEWIVGGDPDGWEGNYPVAYWYDEYRQIWLDPDGLLHQIVEAGFDGVYLDWIEAYSDENVIAFAEAENVDPRQEMIWWIAESPNSAAPVIQTSSSSPRTPPNWLKMTSMSRSSMPSPRSKSGSTAAQTTNRQGIVRYHALRRTLIPQPITIVFPLHANTNTTNTQRAPCT